MYDEGEGEGWVKQTHYSHPVLCPMEGWAVFTVYNITVMSDCQPSWDF